VYVKQKNDARKNSKNEALKKVRIGQFLLDVPDEKLTIEEDSFT
jgi:hypothetical protein